jgi:hypothetical protein
MLRQPVEYTTIPVRLFTRANVGGLALTPAAEESGGWFGPPDYVRQYERLWGDGWPSGDLATRLPRSVRGLARPRR